MECFAENFFKNIYEFILDSNNQDIHQLTPINFIEVIIYEISIAS